jgi:hypothetical protein
VKSIDGPSSDRVKAGYLFGDLFQFFRKRSLFNLKVVESFIVCRKHQLETLYFSANLLDATWREAVGLDGASYLNHAIRKFFPDSIGVSTNQIFILPGKRISSLQRQDDVLELLKGNED